MRGGGGRGGRGGGGGGRGGGGFGGRGGGRGFGGGRGYQDQGPPESVVEAGVFAHACEGEAVCKLSNEKVRHINAPESGPARRLAVKAAAARAWQPAAPSSQLLLQEGGCTCSTQGGATTSPCHAIPCLALQIPYFNAPIFLENKTQIGKVEEILGPINNVVCT